MINTSSAAALLALPSILAVQRGLVVSDATFFNVFEDGGESPVWVTRGGIRGTVNTIKRQGGEDDIRNIQTTDTAKLHPEAVGYRVRFNVASLPLFSLVASVSDKSPGVAAAARSAVEAFLRRCAETSPGATATALEIVCGRYVRNLLNGRWLWRNRAEARAVTVTVSVGSGAEAVSVTGNALGLPLSGADSGKGVFEGEAAGEHEDVLAYALADGFLGRRAVELKVEAMITPAALGAVEVYPSQNYLAKKAVGFARSLYRVPCREVEPDVPMQPAMLGQAALRDQKVGNAIRTIDTWYPQFAERQKPIAIEPNGASLDAMQLFRATPDSSAFDLLTKLNQLSGTAECARSLFMLGCVIRGAVINQEKKQAEVAP